MYKNFIIKGCYIELTTRCNLSCVHCYNNSGKENFHLTFDNLIGVLDLLLKHEVKKITLSGGEPFLYERIYDLLKYISQKNFLVTFATNATLINKKNIEFISSLKNKENIVFQVSLEGATPDTNDVIRGTNSFSKVIKTIDLLKCYNLKYYFRVSISPFNSNDIEKIVEFAIKRKTKHLDFSFVLPYGRARDKALFLNDEQKVEVLTNIIDLHKKYKKDINVLIPHFERQGCPIFGERKEAVVIPRIDAKGNVFPCQLMNLAEYSIGNIYNDNLFDLLKSDKLIDIDNFIKYKNKYNSECKKCYAFSICKYGCPAVSVGNNLISSGDGFCEYRKKVFKDILNKKVFCEKS
ncbi:MAG: radical SAM protein [Ruminococcaceae bacterium]|nr:radical SAM protein [Oscillospiraceae bacterium]